MRITTPTILGYLAGMSLGMCDYWLLRWLDVAMVIDGEDVTLMVVFLFAVNFGALGAVIARLWEKGGELRATQASLVEAQTLAAVGRMAAGVAHEVRNPLSVIRSSAQLLAEDLKPESAEAAQFICDEVDRLDGFVGRVLDFSRPLQAETETLSWANLQQRLIPAVGENVSFEGQDLTYRLDPALTVQLISNLVDNARRSDAEHVRVVASAAGLDVIDDGHGVQPEHREAVFEPFFTTRAKGTGLGLAMARKLARVQGWDLELREASEGACFRLTNPGANR